MENIQRFDFKNIVVLRLSYLKIKMVSVLLFLTIVELWSCFAFPNFILKNGDRKGFFGWRGVGKYVFFELLPDACFFLWVEHQETAYLLFSPRGRLAKAISFSHLRWPTSDWRVGCYSHLPRGQCWLMLTSEDTGYVEQVCSLKSNPFLHKLLICSLDPDFSCYH